MKLFIGTPAELRQEPNEPPNGELFLGIVALFIVAISLPLLLRV
jgi:hypothetical protein